MSDLVLSALRSETLILTLFRSLFAGRAFGDGSCYEQAASVLREHVGSVQAPLLFGFAHALVLELDTAAPRPVDWRPMNCRCASRDEQTILTLIAAAQCCDAGAITEGFRNLGYRECPSEAALTAGRLAYALREAGIVTSQPGTDKTQSCVHETTCRQADFETMLKDLKPC